MVDRDEAEALASLGWEIGARVIRGLVYYPGWEGGLDIGGVDIQELLYEFQNREVLIIVAPLGSAEELPLYCWLSGALS